MSYSVSRDARLARPRWVDADRPSSAIEPTLNFREHLPRAARQPEVWHTEITKSYTPRLHRQNGLSALSRCPVPRVSALVASVATRWHFCYRSLP